MYIDFLRLSKAVFEQCDYILSHLADSNTDNVEHDDNVICDDNVVCDAVIISEETIQE